MELNDEREPRGTSNEITLSEDALRQLSKSLTVLIPRNADSLEDGAFGYKVVIKLK